MELIDGKFLDGEEYADLGRDDEHGGVKIELYNLY